MNSMRLKVDAVKKQDATMEKLYSALDKRMAAAPAGNCPVEQTAAFLKVCLSQSCGKCVPCRIGLKKLAEIIDGILDGNGTEADLELLANTAQTVFDSADCAIGFEGARLVLDGLADFKADYLAHLQTGKCTAEFKAVPCVANCPAHVDIPGYIALVKDGRPADAVRLIRQDNPFPSVCALICEHPCEKKCRRTFIDAPVNIRGIKRYAVDKGGVVPPPECAPATGKSVGVIGSGPSGLTAAYFLSLMGHDVTVYEKRERTGGMLRYGIPCYRLPDDYLDRDIDAIKATGVKIETGVNIGTDMKMADLLAKHDCVYISIGAHKAKTMGIEGEDLRGVHSAVEFLGAVGSNEAPDFTGKRVAVVGGGNVAMDVIRTAKRLGAEHVTCVYRRREEDMTALPEEIAGGIAEGCEIRTLLSPVRIVGDENGQVTGLVAQPQVIGEYDRGRAKPYNAAVPEETIPCDIVIGAIGQAIDSAYFNEEGLATERNAFVTDVDGVSTDKERIFAGGDCVFGPATVIRVIAAGKVAAANIDEYLGTYTPISAGVEIPAASPEIKKPCGRVNMQERPADERNKDFVLMEQGYTEEEAMQECSRCLRCDHNGFGGFKEGRNFSW